MAACGSSSEDSGGDGVAFTYAAAAVGPLDAFYEEALRRTNEEFGYQGKWVEVEEPEVAVSGVASDEFQFSHGVTATAMAAQEAQSANLVFVGNFIKNFWAVGGKTSITDCDGLNGAKFGLNSPGGVSTALFNAWKSEKCSAGVEPELQYIDGSDNRVQGLLTGQLDAAMVDINGTLRFNDELHVIADMATEVPGIETNNVFVNAGFAESNPEVVTNLLANMIELSQEIVDDPTVLAGLIKEDFPDFAEDADGIAELYAERELFDPTGGTQIADMDKTLALYQSVEAVGPGLQVDKSINRTYLDAALAETAK
jgi:ABC-type nitrate/sulfonate/bicarbonate transport system substrate-binding protein